MVDVYCYLPSSEVNDVVECGLKLSRWFDREVRIEGETRKCISTLLNPRDDMEKYKSTQYKCIKLEVHPQYCYAADRCLYLLGLDNSQIMELYMSTITPIGKYVFGSYRLPECLITSTVISEQMSVLNKRLDSPILFDSSEELYINNIIESYKEEHRNFNDTLLYYFYCSLAAAGKLDRIDDTGRQVAVFLEKERGKAYTIKIPDKDTLL